MAIALGHHQTLPWQLVLQHQGAAAAQDSQVPLVVKCWKILTIYRVNWTECMYIYICDVICYVIYYILYIIDCILCIVNHILYYIVNDAIYIYIILNIKKDIVYCILYTIYKKIYIIYYILYIIYYTSCVYIIYYICTFVLRSPYLQHLYAAGYVVN